MHKETSVKELPKEQADTGTVSLFSKEIVRDILLPDLLGKDQSPILYWAGKRLARKFPLDTIEDIQEFFVNAGWGELVQHKDSKKEAEYILQGQIISRRFGLNNECDFQLEAGFLAQQMEMIQKRITEAVVEPKQKTGKVKFLVRWDLKDVAEPSDL